MGSPLSIRLDDDDQATLEDAAAQRGLGLSTYLRQIAAEEAKKIRRERIRQQSAIVGQYVNDSEDAQTFYADWGSSRPAPSA